MTIFGIILTKSDLRLLGIVGGLIVILISYRLANTRDKINRRAVAAIKFRDVFHAEFKGLYPIPSNWPKDFTFFDKRLRESFVALQVAATEFRNFIPWYQRWFFDRVWRRYRLGKDGRNIGQQYYEQYHSDETTPSHSGKETTIITDGKKNFKHNVDKLLSFAKQK